MCIFRFIKWIDEGVPIELFGDGSQSRDFTYVDDIASGSIAAAKRVGYEIFNLGGGRNPVSLNQIIGSLEGLLRKPARIDHKPFHIADIKETWAEIEKAKRILGWTPATSLDDGLAKCVKWYLENKEWLKGIKM
jgi:nucleoside-diphosphate-sugar epimerase